jgi:hypothetical protein
MTSGGLFAFSTLLLAPQNCGEPYSFFYFLAKTQRRKEIVIARYDFRRPLQPAPQNCSGLLCFARYSFYFSSRKGLPRRIAGRKEIALASGLLASRRPLRLCGLARQILFF